MAEYVQTFRDPTFGGSSVRLTEAALAVIARSRPVLTIFPNLRVLYMTSLGSRKLFMSPSVVEFVWRIDAAVVGQDMMGLCEDIVDAMPCIRVLRIQVACVLYIEDALIWLCKHLPQLERLVLPLYGLTSLLFHELSSVKTLVDIDFERAIGEPLGASHPPLIAAIDSFSIAARTFIYPSFPRLTRLSISLKTFDALFEVLRSSALNLQILRRLIVRIPYSGTDVADKVLELSKFLAEHTRSLRELSLYLAPRDAVDITSILMSRYVGMSDLAPILGLRSLRAFSIHLANPLDLDDSDLEEVALSLPKIVTLVLNPHPSLATPSSATFAALIPFSEWCPDLRDLGLYLDGKVDCRSGSGSPFGTHFHSLRLGRSCLPGAEDLRHRRQIAACLGDLLPTTTPVVCLCTTDVMDSVDYGPRMYVGGTEPIWHQWRREFRSNWTDIAMLVRAVAEERRGRCKQRMYMDEAMQD